MNNIDRPDLEMPKRKSIPLWAGFVLSMVVWGGIPWALSLLTRHLGWVDGLPGPWNWVSLFPGILGLLGLLWGLLLHSGQTPRRLDMEPAKDYLLRNGLYRFTRNPMYLSELILMFGWVIFYGSGSVLIGLFAWWAFFNFYQVPSEERVLEANFGESYRTYKDEVPRWIGGHRRK